jgi:hypothetical protein
LSRDSSPDAITKALSEVLSASLLILPETDYAVARSQACPKNTPTNPRCRWRTTWRPGACSRPCSR